MSASVYSYRVMVKSVSSCCVHGRRVLSNPVTYECENPCMCMGKNNNRLAYRRLINATVLYFVNHHAVFFASGRHMPGFLKLFLCGRLYVCVFACP